MSVRVAGIILAAGRSTRMGSPKQLLEIDGRPMIAHVIDTALATTLDEIVVVVGHAATRIRAAIAQTVVGAGRGKVPLRVVEAGAEPQGISQSLRVGIRAACAAGADAAAVLLGDEPDVRACDIDRCLERYRGAGAVAAVGDGTDDSDGTDDGLATARPDIVRAVYIAGDTRRPGHPVVFDSIVFPEIDTLDGDRGARAVVEALSTRVVEVEIEGGAPVDIDTPEELEARRRGV